ncbi:MAG: hypothetical protein IT578_04060 [Verrucomicrobiae bacterium]|nr:hypothetical protein [Verrucomicrobiae bacterium]
MTLNHLASFRADVTPPLGHPLCAGWYDHALAISDPLHALGIVLFGDEAPLVLCALDWAEMSNLSHLAWRERLATAAGTTADRVVVQCVHPHCTPWPDEEADRLVRAFPDLPRVMDPVWCAGTLERVAAAVAEAARRPRRLTHLGLGQAKVEKVASNRRVMGPDGRVKAVRWTQTRDPSVRAEPEGLIDPWLKTISFWDDAEKIAALHYYAVHPTSYDHDPIVTPDFTGLARDRRAAEEPGVLHAYFTGCAGNITAGKYNDGARENRTVFTERIHRAMVESERDAPRLPVARAEWRVANVILPPREDETMEQLLTRLGNASCLPRLRTQAALQIAYRRRMERPIPITALSFGEEAHLVHLPGESFIEYQIFAQQLRPKAWVAVASYGDCGPGYICMENSGAEGGYEPVDSFVAGRSEAILKNALRTVLDANRG